jgi:HAD superfamily hydrolase (TIGR01549 family)
MRIESVCFDLGSTLIYSPEPWTPIFQQADQALVTVLQRAGFPVDLQGLHKEHETFMETYYSRRDQDNRELTSLIVLKEILVKKGFGRVPDPILRAALDAEYAITQTNWRVEEDALPTLETLRSQGYRLALISNTSDDRNVQTLVDRFGFRPYFDAIITSAALGVRKPDPRIFQAALDQLASAPQHAAMVGDMPEADILGADQLGMFSIWILRRAANSESPVRADATVNRLDEIPALLAALPADIP